MTRPVIKKVTCPNCGTEDDFTIFTSINVTLDPELQKKMENGELFIWECPKCGKKYICIYPFLYHDMDAGYIVQELLHPNIPEDKLAELGLSGTIKLDW